jgi:hypothetical protein
LALYGWRIELTAARDLDRAGDIAERAGERVVADDPHWRELRCRA